METPWGKKTASATFVQQIRVYDYSELSAGGDWGEGESGICSRVGGKPESTHKLQVKKDYPRQNDKGKSLLVSSVERIFKRREKHRFSDKFKEARQVWGCQGKTFIKRGLMYVKNLYFYRVRNKLSDYKRKPLSSLPYLNYI